jgi:phosphatidylinositol kinase/protein kinase (PI-3  family)
LFQLLTDLGKHHPQALVYPLTVACKSSNAARKTAANKILNKIREHSETLVNQVGDGYLLYVGFIHETFFSCPTKNQIVARQ